jgi:hypothetical protein
MHTSYQDIRSRIPIQPLWWDEQAVPRYDPFTPYLLADIYAIEAALMEIECQGCGHKFLVAFSVDRIQMALGEVPTTGIDVQALHYGDPPNVGCCDVGATMNSIPRRVVEFWRRDVAPLYTEWVRVPELEVEIDADWAK